LKVLL